MGLSKTAVRAKTQSDAESSSLPRFVALLFPAAALLTVLITAFHTITDPDIWFHLRTGRDIVTTGAIPRVDTLSYPSAGRPYVDLHWLYQVIVLGVHRIAGEPGLIAFAGMILLATWSLVYRLARRSAPVPLAAALVAFGAILASERTAPRPELLSFLYLALTMWLVRRHEEGWRRAAFLLPALFVLWVNTEGLFVLGYAVLGAAILTRHRDRRLWIATGASVVASFLNPWFLEGAIHPFVLFTRINNSMPIYSATIGEFLSPFADLALHPAVMVYPVWLGLIGVGLIARGRWPRLGEVVLAAVFVYLSLSARRNIALLAFVTTPILAGWLAHGFARPALARRWRRISAPRRRALATGLAVFGFTALLSFQLAVVTNKTYVRAESNNRFGFHRAEVDFPREAVEFLRANGVRGPVFSTLETGSFLTWAWPEEPVFIDGRLEVSTAAHYERYLRLLRDRSVWAGADQEFAFNILIVRYMNAVDFTLERLRDPVWAPVYLDDIVLVLVRKNDAHEALIRDHALTVERLYARFPALPADRVDMAPALPAPPSTLERIFSPGRFSWHRMHLGQFFLLLGRDDLALPQLIEAARLAPAQPAPRLMIATALNRMGHPDRALETLEQARELGGNAGMRARMLAIRGDILTGLGRHQEAVGAYTEWIRKSTVPTQTGSVLASRALARLRAGDVNGAAADITEGLRLDPSNAQSYWVLGSVEEARGRSDAARTAYQRFQALGGRSPEVEAALRRLGGT